MRRDGRVALALASLFAACSVYDPSVLTGDGDTTGGSAGTSRGGSAGKASGGSGGKATTSGAAGSDSGGSSARGGSAGTTGSGGSKSGNGGAAGEAGAPGDGGEANGGEGDGSGGSGVAGTSGVGGTSGTGGDGAGGSNGGSAGTDGGSSGAGAGGSGGGKAGAGGGGTGGSSGTGGSAGAGGAGGTSSGEVCSGCARLSVSLQGALDKAHFMITMPANTNFEDAVVALRVFRRAGSGGQLHVYVQHGGGPFGFASLDLGSRDIADLSGWEDISFDLGPITGYDKTIVRRLGIEVIGTGSTAWTNPTVIYVDSVSIANTVLNPSVFAFDTADTVSTTPSTSSPPDQRMWLNNGPNDTTVAASLSWLGP